MKAEWTEMSRTAEDVEEGRAAITLDTRTRAQENDFCTDSKGGTCNSEAGKSSKKKDQEPDNEGLQTAVQRWGQD